jgi:hypothetical protein
MGSGPQLRRVRDGNRQAREPEPFLHPCRSRNSESDPVAFQENSPCDCKKPILSNAGLSRAGLSRAGLSRAGLSSSGAGRVKLFAVQLPLKSPWAVALAHQLARSWRRGGCQVRHAPLVAMRCICMPVAAKRSEYRYILKNPLTGIVFVPVLSSTLQRYTTRAIEVPKIFV